MLKFVFYLLPLRALQLGNVPQREPRHLEVLLEEGEYVLVEDLLLLKEVVVGVDEALGGDSIEKF